MAVIKRLCYEEKEYHFMWFSVADCQSTCIQSSKPL